MVKIINKTPFCIRADRIPVTYGGEERRMQGFGGETEGKRQLWRPRCRWEDNFKMDLQEMGCRGMDWIELAQDRDR